jgi:hypothetical protein
VVGSYGDANPSVFCPYGDVNVSFANPFLLTQIPGNGFFCVWGTLGPMVSLDPATGLVISADNSTRPPVGISGVTVNKVTTTAPTWCYSVAGCPVGSNFYLAFTYYIGVSTTKLYQFFGSYQCTSP